MKRNKLDEIDEDMKLDPKGLDRFTVVAIWIGFALLVLPTIIIIGEMLCWWPR